MIDRNQLDRLDGIDVVGPDGDKIGSVDDVYVDDATGEPTFALVNTGLFGMRSSFVPLRDANVDGDQLRVTYDKDKVKDAPNMDKDGHLEPSEEQELYRYYGMSYSDTDTRHDMGRDTGRTDMGRTDTGRTGETTGAVGRDTSAGTDDDAMTRSEEELHVGTREREVGRARLRKHVVTENVTKTIPVQKEEVRIEREPITDANRDAATDGPAISEDEHEVIIHEEEPVVEKRTVPKERVRLDKETHTDEERVEDEVAREEIDLAGVEESRQDQTRR